MAFFKGVLGKSVCLCGVLRFAPFGWFLFLVSAQMHLPVKDLGTSSHEFSSSLISGIQKLFPNVFPLAALLPFRVFASYIAYRGRIGKPSSCVRALCGVFFPVFVGQIHLSPDLP